LIKVSDDDSRVFKLIELIMLLREKVWLDLFQILCYAPTSTRKQMAGIIFHYYPSLLILDVVVERSRRDELQFKVSPILELLVNVFNMVRDEISTRVI
jgi:hypothetical protein